MTILIVLKSFCRINTITNVRNFSKIEMQKIIEHILNLKDDIFDYIKEKEGSSLIKNICNSM